MSTEVLFELEGTEVCEADVTMWSLLRSGNSVSTVTVAQFTAAEGGLHIMQFIGDTAIPLTYVVRTH